MWYFRGTWLQGTLCHEKPPQLAEYRERAVPRYISREHVLPCERVLESSSSQCPPLADIRMGPRGALAGAPPADRAGRHRMLRPLLGDSVRQLPPSDGGEWLRLRLLVD